MCPRRLPALLALVLCACAAPAPYVAPAAAGKGAAEVSRLVAASEARLFPCSITQVKGMGGAADVALEGAKPEVTLLPGRYRVTMNCASAQHSFKPQADVQARAGKGYTLTGYLIDDSITIFTMKMRVKVAELP